MSRPEPTGTLQHPSVVFRCFGAALLLLLAILVGRFSEVNSPVAVSLVLGGGLLFLTVDYRNPLCLRNLFLLYTVALFAFGVPAFDLSSSLYLDMVLYIGIFLAGYVLSSLRTFSAHADKGGRPPPAAATSLDRVRIIEEWMLIMVALEVLLLAVRITQYGVAAFYSGQPLLDLHNAYGQANVASGVYQICIFFLKYTSLALIIIYVQTCLLNEVRVQYRYPTALLVILPILGLARSDALIGAFTLLGIYAVERRIRSKSASSVREQVVPPGPVPRAGPRRRLVLGATLFIALIAALVIGGIRQSKLSPDSASESRLERSIPLLRSELSPIKAYAEIKENQERLGRQYGSTIVFPLLLKVVPRSLFPGKPLNSGAYYMSIIRPNELALNYALPTTIFGDGLLSFGMGGAVLLSLVLGWVVARLDRPYKDAQLLKLPWFLIGFANIYALLRDPLSESLAGILLTALMWLVFRRLGADQPAPAARGPRRRGLGDRRTPVGA